jgi:hypothetical protein
VPRVVNVAVAATFLLFLVPLYVRLPGRSVTVQVVLVVVGMPFTLVAAACLASAIRPGFLRRFTRRSHD